MSAALRRWAVRLQRRKLEAIATTTLMVVAAGAVVSRGPLLERGNSVVMQLLTRPIAPTVVAEITDRLESERQPAWDLPNLDHADVDRWVARLTGPMKPSLGTYLRRMERYEEMIVEKATARGMPSDLVYLALIESGGNPTALSPVKARGLWQFMTPTAKAYGLNVSAANDERIDPSRSTDAALRYLGDLYTRFGSWYLAAAAYNGGQGRVSRVLKEVTGKTQGTDEDFYRIAHRLPKETRDYVPKMIAVARVAKDRERFGFTAEYIASRPLTEPRVVRSAPAKKTVATKPAARKPAATTAARKPATATAARKPATATAARKPATATAARKPATATAARKPATATAAKKPATATAARKPAAATAARKPATATAARKPAAATAARKPATATAAKKPATATAAKKPAAATAARKPATAAAAKKPVAKKPAATQTRRVAAARTS
jgi:membrane-bound lytic murein transglycosylase D